MIQTELGQPKLKVNQSFHDFYEEIVTELNNR